MEGWVDGFKRTVAAGSCIYQLANTRGGTKRGILPIHTMQAAPWSPEKQPKTGWTFKRRNLTCGAKPVRCFRWLLTRLDFLMMEWMFSLEIFSMRLSSSPFRYLRTGEWVKLVSEESPLLSMDRLQMRLTTQTRASACFQWAYNWVRKTLIQITIYGQIGYLENSRDCAQTGEG